jgi:hypothetical protein
MSARTLSIEQALKMSSEGEVSLDNIRTLDEGVAEILAQYPGKLDLGWLWELSASDAHALAKREGKLDFHCIKLLTPEALTGLSSHQGDLFLTGLDNLSDNEAEILSSHVGTLDIKGVLQISDLAAEHLSKHQGSINLSGLKTLSDKAADHLSRHRGKLTLWRLTHLSDAAVKSLAGHDGPVLLFPLIEISPEARTIMQRHRANICRSMGLPMASEMDSYKGTFQQSGEDHADHWNLIYYPQTIQDPVSLDIYWRDDTPRPKHIPHWFVELFPALGKCIEEIYWKSLEQCVVAPAYLMKATAEIHPESIWGIYLDVCDAEAVYWEPHVDLDDFPNEFHISCFGGNHYQSIDYLDILPLNHSMHDARLVDLKYWDSNPGLFPWEIKQEPS